ncbi:hypothetical protein [Phenylobacterium sp.]|uniref:hypothetical protein n=1 Tax=Phenylobacterium sp. TaxID=1871053 RepID=UPI002732B18E|nr:hypothetical protein [Phenylobacterium sp.]MDP3853258.1 hypothetical protein [Phenylobacterium sp.]
MSQDVPLQRPAFVAPKSMAETFRKAIEAAELAGTARDAMTLRLTLRDASNIRRDNRIAVEDLSFAGGEMRLLQVKVVTGGVDVSMLDLGA